MKAAFFFLIFSLGWLCTDPSSSPAGLEISLTLNKGADELYVEGEKIIPTVQASRDCYLQIVYHDAGGNSMLIYPNDGSSPEGRIKGGREVALGLGIAIDGYEFEVSAPYGGEMIRAYASTKKLPLPRGVRLDGGMRQLDERDPDKLDVRYQDAADAAGAILTDAVSLLKTAQRIERRTSRDKIEISPAVRFEKPRVFGLVVGVSSYRSPRIRSLRYSGADAELIADFLRSPDGAGIKEDRLRVLVNEEASRKKILESFSGFLSQTRGNDLVFIYFAGHGITDPSENATYFLSSDADLEDLPSTAVDQAKVTEILTKRVRAGKIVFFIDACHGGGLGLTGIRMRGSRTVLSGKLLTELVSRKNGTAFFSASRAMEQSYEGPKWGEGHGVFTHYLVRGLREEADLDDDGRVTISELEEYVSEKVKNDTSGLQHPELKGYFDNDLVLSVLR